MPSLLTINKVRSLRRLSSGRTVFLTCALLIPLVVLAFILVGQQRSYLIEAETSVLRLEFHGANAWSFQQATLCEPLKSPDRDAVPNPGEACSAIDQSAGDAQPLTMNWPDGTPAILRAEAGLDGPRLRIILPAGLGEAHDPGTEIVVAPDPASPMGALLFSGEAVLGTVLGSGERYFLHSATWEARQTSAAMRWLRSSTEKVMTGKAIRGAELSIVDRYRDGWQWRPDHRPARVFGHLTLSPVGEHEPPSFSVTLVSEPGRTELQVGHYGLADTARIRPDLIDTTATSVLLIAAIAFFSLASAATQLIGDLMYLGRGADANTGDGRMDAEVVHDSEDQRPERSDVTMPTGDRATPAVVPEKR